MRRWALAAVGLFVLPRAVGADTILTFDPQTTGKWWDGVAVQHFTVPYGCTGARLPILLEDEYRSGPMIAVGFNSKLRAPLRMTDFGELTEDELVIHPGNGVLLLAGGRPRGALHAVYEYLHRLGVRWYTPQYTRTPERRTIAVPDAPYRYRPPLLGRNVGVGNKGGAEWMARNRLTSKKLWSPLGTKYGSPYAQGPDMHTFYRLIPKPVLEAHPDWLAEVDGKRELPVGHTWGLCLSKAEVREHVIARTLDYARKHPAVRTVWVGQNDGSAYCTCDGCQAFYDAHGGVPSSLIVQLCNELSDAMAEALPGRLVKTLAYSWSLTPPTGMQVRDNVVVMFCAGGSYFQPIATDPQRVSLRESMSAWGKLVKHMDVYLYFPHENYWFPAPCTYAGADNIKWCAQNGADHLYAAVSGWMNWYGSESMNLRAWVYARLMWDPTLNPQALIDEFVRDYYGPAADAVATAIRWTHTDVLDQDGNLRKHNDSPLAPEYLNPTTIREINELFEATHESLPEGDFRKHLRYAWIPYLWADFWLGYEGTGRYSRADGTWSVPMADGALRNRYGLLAKQFMSEHGVEALKERRKINPEALSLGKMGVPWKACLLRDGGVEAVVVPGVGGKIFDFHDERLDFAPLKPSWRGLTLEYPLFSSTADVVNGSPVTEYEPVESTPRRAVLAAAREDCEIRKTVTLADGVLATDFSVKARTDGEVTCHNCVMFDLAEGVFDSHPVVYIERAGGTWTHRAMGTETDFWWVEDNLDLKNATGRLVIQRQHHPEGVVMTFDPAQVERLYFWYDRYSQGPKEQCGMLRFFLHAKPQTAEEGGSVRLTWGLQIVAEAGAVVGRR